jgi:hypothetical protein
MLLPLRLLAAAQTDSEIAIHFFPQDLKDSLAEGASGGAPALVNYITTARTDLDGSGKQNYLVCVYTDTENGALRIVRTDSQAPMIAAEAPRGQMRGSMPGIRLIDLDNDRKPEIIVDFMVGRGYENNWIYKWTGSGVRVLNPSSQSGKVKSFGPIEFLSLTDDGRLAVVTQQPTLSVVGKDRKAIEQPTQSFLLGPTGLIPGDVITHQRVFERSSGQPEVITESFSVKDLTKSYVLKIVDLNLSKPDLGPLLSSVEVSLNGKQIIGPNSFKPGVRNKVISIPASLTTTNELKVKMAGAPGSRMLLMVLEAK